MLLEVDGVSKAFGGVAANREISLSVPAGAVHGLIGPNGSGKTTLFNSIVGHPGGCRIGRVSTASASSA